jgi:adenylate cyclase
LPRSIAKRLKEGEIHIIDHFDGVTILFVDLVGFTVASANMRPSFLIGSFLADVFSAWEKICVTRSMEKIKTIGDAFMVVGGLDASTTTSHPNGEDTASQMVLLGLDMQEALDTINKRYDLSFKCRIGIHSGPVIAGVIGVRKFAFDVWGDAVNTASRMESHGIPGYLHMSSETHEKVKHQLSHIDIRCRGEIDVKGKGKMKTYTIKMPQRPSLLNPSIAPMKSQSLLIVPPEISMKNK